MWLLNVDTFDLEEFFADRIPAYAILSHTWDDAEVSFEDVKSRNTGWDHKPGWSKVAACARKAASDRYKYIWVDTCCIDKKSSAELQEAINSMFQWYQRAGVCYAYLADVPTGDQTRSHDSSFRQARWFTRGWTLQELLAPKQLLFFSQDWKLIGDKTLLLEDLHEVTGIRKECLSNPQLLSWASVAERMSWAASRSTTRVEDMAYCLLGIFGIHMPMLYGEGMGAFRRLQEEIMKVNEDATLLAWGPRGDTCGLDMAHKFRAKLLADSPADFAGGRDVRQILEGDPGYRYNRFFMTQRGLQVTLDLVKDPHFQDLAYGVLNCHHSHNQSNQAIAFPILLRDNLSTAQMTDSTSLLEGCALFVNSIRSDILPTGLPSERTTICLRRHDLYPSYFMDNLRLKLNRRVRAQYRRFRAYPPCQLYPILTRFRNTTMKQGGLQWEDFILIWLEHIEYPSRNVLIRLRTNSGIHPFALSHCSWDVAPKEEAPTLEFFMDNILDTEFWDKTERCDVYGGYGDDVVPAEELFEFV